MHIKFTLSAGETEKTLIESLENMCQIFFQLLVNDLCFHTIRANNGSLKVNNITIAVQSNALSGFTKPKLMFAFHKSTDASACLVSK